MEPPLADVVSFEERARARRTGRTRDAEGAPPAASAVGEAAEVTGEPADLAREAMYRRFAQLTPASLQGPLRSIDDELAVLVYDSAMEPEPLLGVRGGSDGPRQLTFQGPGLVLEVELDLQAGELTCQVVPPQPASLEVRHGKGTIPLGSDEFGTFYAPMLPEGAISLRCEPKDASSGPTCTGWITVPARLPEA